MNFLPEKHFTDLQDEKYNSTYPRSNEILSDELPIISLVPNMWLIDNSPGILPEWFGVWWPDGDFFISIPGRTQVASPTAIMAYN